PGTGINVDFGWWRCHARRRRVAEVPMRRSLALLLTLATPAAAQSGAAPFTVVETGQGFANLDDAVQSIRMGTATILIAPGAYKQCTVQAGGNITFKAVQPGTAVFDGE